MPGLGARNFPAKRAAPSPTSSLTSTTSAASGSGSRLPISSCPLSSRSHCTQKQARAALAESALRCSEMLAQAAPQGRVQSFLRDGWARPWQPGAAMFAYMVSHDAHHRGQACMLAHQLGFRLHGAAAYGMWGWEKLWKDCGFELPSGAELKSRTRRATNPKKPG
jgi:DinB family